MTIEEAARAWTEFFYPRRRRSTVFFGCWPLMFVVLLWVVLKLAIWAAGMILIAFWFGIAGFVTFVTRSRRRY